MNEISKDVIGITIWPGSNPKYLNELLCSLLSDFTPSDRLNRVNITLTKSSKQYRNNIFNMNTNDTVSDIVRESYMNLYIINQNDKFNTNNPFCLGTHKYSPDINYENLKIDIEFICDGMNKLIKKCNYLENIDLNMSEINDINAFNRYIRIKCRELKKYNNDILIHKLNILYNYIENNCTELDLREYEQELSPINSEYTKYITSNRDTLNFNNEEFKNKTLSFIKTLYKQYNIINIIKQFNKLYYSRDDLFNLYGSAEHVSVMCSRNHFLKKHRNDYKMFCDDDDLTTGLNNYKLYFNYARKKYKTFNGKINVIHISTLDKKYYRINSMCSYIYLPTKTQIWNSVNFMLGEDVDFTWLHEICKDVFVYKNTDSNDPEFNYLPLIYMYRGISNQGNYNEEMDFKNSYDDLYYLITSILASNSKIGGYILLIMLYNILTNKKLECYSYLKIDRISIIKDKSTGIRIENTIKYFNNKFIEMYKNSDNNTLYEIKTRELNIDFNTLFLGNGTRINANNYKERNNFKKNIAINKIDKYNEMDETEYISKICIKSDDDEKLYNEDNNGKHVFLAGLISDQYNIGTYSPYQELKYNEKDIFDICFEEFERDAMNYINHDSLINILKTILSNIKRYVKTIDESKSQYYKYRPDTIIEFKTYENENSYYDYITDNNKDLISNDKDYIDKFNIDILTHSDMYGGSINNLFIIMFIIFIIIIIVIVVIIIIKRYKNKNKNF